MKKLQQFCVITTLTLTLTLSAFAGEMGCPGVTANNDTPPPSGNVAGEILTPGATTDTMTEMALGFLLNLSSLL
jgi:hypothetical protein